MHVVISSKATFPKWVYKVRVAPYFGLLNTQQALGFCMFSSMAISLWTFCNSVFELHLYAVVHHDVTYYGKWGMSYEFVYSGTPAVRSALIFFCVLSGVVSFAVFLSTALLMGLNSKDKRQTCRPASFLLATFGFVVFRTCAYIFSSFVNDPMYGYWVAMGLLNTMLVLIQAENGLVFWTLYLNTRDVDDPNDPWRRRTCTESTTGNQPARTEAIPMTSYDHPQTEVLSAEEIFVFSSESPDSNDQPDTPSSPLLVVLHQISRHPDVRVHSV